MRRETRIVEANVEILKAVKGRGVEPALDLGGFFDKPFLGLVKSDEVEVEAAGRAGVVGEDLGDDGDALEPAGAEAAGVDVERRGAPERTPPAG